MIVLDTNAIAEPWKSQPDHTVIAWTDAQMVETLYPSTITVAEVRFGLATMPDGNQRRIYQERLEGEVLPVFSGRILSFDLAASQAYAALMARARAAGRGIGRADGYIAATARRARNDGRRPLRRSVRSGRPDRHQSLEGDAVRRSRRQFARGFMPAHFAQSPDGSACRAGRSTI